MSLPMVIGDAAQNADRDRVIAWLDAGGSINDADEGGFTLLNCCASGDIHGSYKRYARSFHRDVLTVRGLAQRGKLSTDDSVLNFLARLGDNGVVWHVLSFWRATN